jgi:tetratricopeptide (TPR) repeat protein
LGHAEQAESLLDTAIARYGAVPEMLFMRGRARGELGKSEALDDVKHSYALKPSGYALKALASLLYMSGEESEFRELLRRETASHPVFAGLAASLLKDAGDPAAAIDLLANRDDDEELLASRAAAHLELDQAERAEALSRKALERAPDHRVSSGHLVTALLMQGRYEDALSVIRELRQLEPDRQHWIAYEATALRHTDPDAYRALVRVDEHVKAFRLPTPQGYASLEQFNDAFLRVLETLHLYRRRPLDQSLRHGTQTPRDLMGIDDPVIQAFRDAVDEPIRAYLDSIGRDGNHPLTARNRGSYRFQGCWSVRLIGQGYHVNHVHPEGWISSAYYVSVPPLSDDGRHAGWIKFGEPPFATAPASPPERWVRPESGMLVLFPSFLWHGTGPIDDGAVRVTAPFDAVPA